MCMFSYLESCSELNIGNSLEKLEIVRSYVIVINYMRLIFSNFIYKC